MSVLTVPLNMDDVIADPTLLQNAIDQKAKDDPAAVAQALSAYMKDDATRQHMIDEANEGLQAIHDIQVAFGSVYGLLAQVDAQNFTGSDGKVIQKFAPLWRTYSDAFTTSLSQTETLAAKGKAAIDTFVKTIIPILQNTSTSVDYKKTRLTFFVNTMDQNDQNVKDIDALILVFDGISKDVTSFKATFEETMTQVGNTLTSDIQRANEDIALLQEKLEAQLETAKKLGIAAGVSIGVGGVMVATGVLAPVGMLLGLAGIIMGAVAIDAYFNKVAAIKTDLANKKDELVKLQGQQNAYNKLSPDIKIACANMVTISTKLGVLAGVFKTVKADIVEQNQHLSTASGADDLDIADVRDQEIELAAASYANLAQILQTFADGWTTATTAPTAST
ncbi:hypothetical protein B0H16DRAFT_59069 [Mycena metata]|uniref:Haemolytic enterotoxin (HBL) n=1 Tax=Mycena metata TaxID=1033252 RepID=A0AAD7IDX6_9AGAR|nr:hypothetical protein B0H16DRAFT_59069 [Mycena metata]